MFSRSHKTTTSRSTPSIIAGNCAVAGDIVAEGELHVDGRVEGDVRCTTLIVGQTGMITGEISAETVRILGAVTGQISARAVDLAKTARVLGDITHESLSVEAGAHIEGRFNRLPSAAGARSEGAENEGQPGLPGMTVSAGPEGPASEPAAAESSRVALVGG